MRNGAFEVNRTEWQAVPGYAGLYEAAADGRIRNTRTLHVLRPFKGDARGHVKVSLSRSGDVRDEYVHRIVASAFLGPPPPGTECRHRNGNPADNAVTNLQWGTRAENVRDAIEHGTYRNANAEKTQCKRRHDFTPENTYRDPSGRRRCRECKRGSKRNGAH